MCHLPTGAQRFGCSRSCLVAMSVVGLGGRSLRARQNGTLALHFSGAALAILRWPLVRCHRTRFRLHHRHLAGRRCYRAPVARSRAGWSGNHRHRVGSQGQGRSHWRERTGPESGPGRCACRCTWPGPRTARRSSGSSRLVRPARARARRGGFLSDAGDHRGGLGPDRFGRFDFGVGGHATGSGGAGGFAVGAADSAGSDLVGVAELVQVADPPFSPGDRRVDVLLAQLPPGCAVSFPPDER